jgi:hypothetical protein
MAKKPINPVDELKRLNAQAIEKQPAQDAATKELEAGIEARRRSVAAAETERKTARVRRRGKNLTTQSALTGK